MESQEYPPFMKELLRKAMQLGILQPFFLFLFFARSHAEIRCAERGTIAVSMKETGQTPATSTTTRCGDPAVPQFFYQNLMQLF